MGGVNTCEEEKNDNRIVKIDIDDIMENLIQKIVDEYGVEWDEVNYEGKIKELEFSLPALNNSLCNEVRVASYEDGCGSTGGGCICGLDKKHEGDHECKRCGEEW